LRFWRRALAGVYGVVVAGCVVVAGGVADWSVVAGCWVVAGCSVVAGCVVVVAGAVSVACWFAPGFRNITASTMSTTTTTIPMMVFRFIKASPQVKCLEAVNGAVGRIINGPFRGSVEKCMPNVA
jgi:hypothetical protein